VWWPRITILAKVASVLIFVGYASIPISVMAGMGRAHAERAKASFAVQDTGKQSAPVAGVAKEALK
jgi:hypothetical protein